MIVYFASRRMDILGLASTGLSRGLSIARDTKTEDIDTGVASFECRICWGEGQDVRAVQDMCRAGNYLLRSDGGSNEFYTIIDVELDAGGREVSLYAEDAGLDLLNEIALPFAADAAHPIAWYVDYFASDSGFELGVNEVPQLTRTLSWEGEQTVTERLRSVATQFDNCELSYSFDVQGMEITHKYINIYARRGKDMDETLRLNRELNRIVVKQSVANIATALYVTGAVPEGEEDGEPVTLEGYTYDDGDCYTDGAYLKSRTALAAWSRYAWEKQLPGYEGHIVQAYSYETESQSTLCAHAVTELQRRGQMEVNYEVDIRVLPESVRIGDRVNIVDDEGELYLSARILRLETSVSSGRTTATLGEYLLRDSGISEQVAELAQQFASLAKTRARYTWIAYADDADGGGISLDPLGKAYLGIAANRTSAQVDITDPAIFSWTLIRGESAAQLRLDASDGQVFQNGTGQTVLTAVVCHGAQRLTNHAGLETVFGAGSALVWSVRTADGAFTDLPADDGRIGADGFSLTVSAADVDTRAVFRCQLRSADGTVRAADEVTLLHVWDLTEVHLTCTAYTFPGSSTAALPGSVTTQVVATRAGEAVAATVSLSEITAPSGVSVTSDADPTAPTLTISVDGSVTEAGTVRIPVHTGQVVHIVTFSFAVAFAGADGQPGDPGTPGSDGVGIAGIVEEYYRSTSSAAQTGGAWSTSRPAWQDGTYLWTRSKITYTDGSSTTTTPICVTGARGESGEDGVGVASVDVQYYLSTSSTSLSGGSWSTTAPTWTDGRYMWSKTVTVYTDGTSSETAPVCITGATGPKGDDGDAAVQYLIRSSVDTVTRSIAGVLSPSSVTFQFFAQTGGTAVQSSYYGRCVIQESADGNSWVTGYTASSNVASVTYTPRASNAVQLRCTLYAAGGTTTALAVKTVPIVFDADAITVLLAEENGEIVVDGSKILAGSVTALQIAASAVTADKLATNAVTTDKLSANAVTADKINVTDLFAQDITATGTISGVHLVGATGSFTGSVTAGSGKIGGWGIADLALYTETDYGSIELYPVVSQEVVSDGFGGAIVPHDTIIRIQGHPSINATAAEADALQDFFSVSQWGQVNAWNLTVSASQIILKNLSVGGSLSAYNGWTMPRIQHGYTTVNLTANTNTDFTITFPKSFPGTPDVLFNLRHNSDATSIETKLKSASSSGFSGFARSSTGGNHVVHWVAVY